MRRASRAGLSGRRIAVARLALVACFLGLAARAAHLAVFDERGAKRARDQLAGHLMLAPERGAILARGGRELALSVDAPSVYAEPELLPDRDAAAAALAGALGRSTASVAARLEGRSSFVFLARWVDAETAARVQALGLRGVGIVREPRRIYPAAGLAPQVVGFANIDGAGVRGIEQAEDEWLRGRPARLEVERDGSRDLLIDQGRAAWRTAGGDVALTLDAAMQGDAQLALRAAVARTGARAGLVVSLDAETGDVLALAEEPGFDPNHFRTLRFPDSRSRAFHDALEPGSTLKAFLVAAALEHGTLRTDQWIDCEEGSWRIPGKTLTDTKPHGMLTPGDVLRVSSNICAVKIAFDLGPERHAATLRRFGFGARTESGFPGESAGVLRTPPRNRPVDHATLAFGQGIAATPVQLATATAALANGGSWRPPRLVAARRQPGGDWQPTRPASPRRVVSPETSRAVMAMLESVVGHDGTGRRAGLRGVRVAGKTGTAQKWDAAAARYSDRRFVAWFIGAVPADAPRLALVVALDEPRRPNHTGGAAAAPLFAQVAAAQLARLGILTEPEQAPAPPDPSWTLADAADAEPSPAPESAASRRALPEVTRLADRILLPDLRGLTVEEVRTITAQASVKLEIHGAGLATGQDPPPGTVMAADSARIAVRFASSGESL